MKSFTQHLAEKHLWAATKLHFKSKGPGASPLIRKPWKYLPMATAGLGGLGATGVAMAQNAGDAVTQNVGQGMAAGAAALAGGMIYSHVRNIRKIQKKLKSYDKK